MNSCPTRKKKELLAESMRLYENPETLKFAREASIQEGEGYQRLGMKKVKPVKPRILEIAEFSDKMGYKRLGLIFCEGLAGEAKAVDKFYTSKGFEMVSVVCKAGRTPKEAIGVRDDQKILSGTFEPMCNPIYQANIVNEEKVDFNILMGLCVGHDSLVIQHLAAPVTILAVKDRLMGHNPLSAVYNIDSYYAYLK
ncbi:hypothetical protein DSCO28_43690 [Desulfosarcina ovata subsp. sediminis]|uniref:Metal-binding protein n=1 Tax=Desulfosarcina ovata subsp. sediminis TaxID=885957 RepID=A0A5K7ZU93_9BACT|nr:hypothetical protein DSCO28_43690 [Desulfosarcina ovata subsp. sediminis]